MNNTNGEIHLIDSEMPFEEHLEELRQRLFRCIATVIICSGIAYYFRHTIMKIIRKPMGNFKLIFLAPNEAFLSYIKLAIFCGILFAIPLVFYQIWRFVSVALFPKEKRIILILFPLSLIFFTAGGLFAYFISLPIGLKFLLTYPPPETNISPMISLSKYINFVGLFLLGFGILFQLPLVVVFLTRLGLIMPKTLSKKRRHVIIGLVLLAAIFTPPDVITQLLLAIPLVLLYELSIWLSYIFAWIRRKESSKNDA